MDPSSATLNLAPRLKSNPPKTPGQDQGSSCQYYLQRHCIVAWNGFSYGHIDRDFRTPSSFEALSSQTTCQDLSYCRTCKGRYQVFSVPLFSEITPAIASANRTLVPPLRILWAKMLVLEDQYITITQKGALFRTKLEEVFGRSEHGSITCSRSISLQQMFSIFHPTIRLLMDIAFEALENSHIPIVFACVVSSPHGLLCVISFRLYGTGVATSTACERISSFHLMNTYVDVAASLPFTIDTAC